MRPRGPDVRFARQRLHPTAAPGAPPRVPQEVLLDAGASEVICLAWVEHTVMISPALRLIVSSYNTPPCEALMPVRIHSYRRSRAMHYALFHRVEVNYAGRML